MQKDTNCNASDFYNNIAGKYDQMFAFKNDLATAENFVAGLKERFSFNNALDIGCGTGSLTLAWHVPERIALAWIYLPG